MCVDENAGTEPPGSDSGADDAASTGSTPDVPTGQVPPGPPTVDTNDDGVNDPAPVAAGGWGGRGSTNLAGVARINLATGQWISPN